MLLLRLLDAGEEAVEHVHVDATGQNEDKGDHSGDAEHAGDDGHADDADSPHLRHHRPGDSHQDQNDGAEQYRSPNSYNYCSLGFLAILMLCCAANPPKP